MIRANLDIASRGILIRPRRIVIAPRETVIAPRILIVFSEILDIRQQLTFEHCDVRVDHSESVPFTAASERKMLYGVRDDCRIG